VLIKFYIVPAYRLPAGRQGRQAYGTKDNRNVMIKSEDLYDLMKMLNVTID
jgi:hypothetical protein